MFIVLSVGELDVVEKNGVLLRENLLAPDLGKCCSRQILGTV